MNPVNRAVATANATMVTLNDQRYLTMFIPKIAYESDDPTVYSDKAQPIGMVVNKRPDLNVEGERWLAKILLTDPKFLVPDQDHFIATARCLNSDTPGYVLVIAFVQTKDQKTALHNAMKNHLWDFKVIPNGPLSFGTETFKDQQLTVK